MYMHGRRRTDGGVEFGTSLPRGTVLRDGDCFVLDATRLSSTVVERPEPVFVVDRARRRSGHCLPITSATAISR